MAGQTEDDQLLRARVRVPEHVVYRDFGDETVILNLDSGNYHGLNRTAALMVGVLGDSATVDDAIGRLVEQTGQPRDVIEPDVVRLCRALSERGLIESEASRDR